MTHRVKPPRGAVTLTDHRPDGGWQVDCTHCGFHHPPAPYVSSRTDAEDAKRWHRCPTHAGGRAEGGAADPDGVATTTPDRDEEVDS